MELLAVIKAMNYVTDLLADTIDIQFFTDSQYLMDLPARANKIKV